jgi:hypothetical protein
MFHHLSAHDQKGVAMDSQRIQEVAARIADYVKSPSLRHVRDPHCIQKLAKEIVQAVDRVSSVWGKWEGSREDIGKAAAPCWIPTEDLVAYLNRLPGPKLTPTDVTQRLRAFCEEPWTSYPNDDLKASCLALFETEKAQGTELPAIIGAIQEHIELEEERLSREQQERYRRQREEERVRLEQRFLAGADCGWTPVGKSESLYCRRNGRAFRITRGKDKRWQLYRIATLEDFGTQLGVYEGRRVANKVLEKIAFEPEF